MCEKAHVETDQREGKGVCFDSGFTFTRERGLEGYKSRRRRNRKTETEETVKGREGRKGAILSKTKRFSFQITSATKRKVNR